MIQSVVIFILGFLSAAFLAVLVIPAIWRRAVSLTRRRIERSVPLTQGEISGVLDGQRAEFAVTARRLEMDARMLKEKLAIQTVELNRAREDMKQLSADLEARRGALADAVAQAEALAAAIRIRDGRIESLAGEMARAEKLIEGRGIEIEKLGSLYEEASFASSSRQIELVARESELEKIRADLAELRGQRKDIDRRHQDLAAEGKASRDALKSEQKKVTELDKKVTRLLATLADREEKLERREREIARLREQPAPDAHSGDETAEAVFRLNAERERLEARLTSLTRENKRLRNGRATLPALTDGAGNPGDDRQLREQIQDLAAEVVHLSARLDGPNSPIAKALGDTVAPNGGGPRSLAERIRALQGQAPADG